MVGSGEGVCCGKPFRLMCAARGDSTGATSCSQAYIRRDQPHRMGGTHGFCDGGPACTRLLTPHPPTTAPAPAPPPLLLQVQRNCVVLPCLHFLYCDSCIKRHCASTPSCPACTRAVTGFQTLMLHR